MVKKPLLYLTITMIIILSTPSLAYMQSQTEPVFVSVSCPVQFNSNTEVECGNVIVPQDRQHLDERSVSLSVAIFHAHSESPLPDPVLFLDGGPGSRTLDSYTNGLHSLLEQMNQTRDVIVFDYRGMGYSDPAMTCPEFEDIRTDDWILACRNRLAEQGVDVTDYTTRDNATDASDIMRALGYETYNIWGGSYGSSVAMTLLRDHPEGIRAAIVTALQPPQGDLQAMTPTGMLRSLTSVSMLCQDDPNCSEVFDLDLPVAFASIVGRFQENPLPVETDEVVGEVNDVDLLFVLSELIKDEANIPIIPGLIASLYAGQYDAVIPYANAATLPTDPRYPLGAWLSMRCTDSILNTTPDALETTLQTLDPAFHDGFMWAYEWQVAVCETWGARIPDEADRQPAVTDTPTLIISGALDPFSSQEWLNSALETLPNGYGFMLPYHAHFVAHNPCAARMLTGFIDDPTTAPDESCRTQIPPPIFSQP